jgi:hypothetical protein
MDVSNKLNIANYEIKENINVSNEIEALKLISESAQLGLIPDADIIVSQETKENLIDTLMCSICYELLFEPITLMCQHTFCKRCIKVSEFNPCANCRLVTFAPPQKNIILNDIIKNIFPEKYNERKMLMDKQDEEKIKQLEEKTREQEEKKKELEIREKFWREIINNMAVYMDRGEENRIGQWRPEEEIMVIQPHNPFDGIHDHGANNDYVSPNGCVYPCANIFQYIKAVITHNLKYNQFQICCISGMGAMIVGIFIQVYLIYTMKLDLTNK